MIKKALLTFFTILLITVTVFSVAHPESASYILLKGHFASAGGRATSGGYITISSLGQISPIGKSQSTTYQLYSGLFTPLFSSYNSIPVITELTADPSQDFTASVFPYTVTFSVTVGDIDSTVFDYSWDFGDGTTDSQLAQGNTLTITHDFTAAKESGPYEVTCTVNDGTAEDSEIVNVYLGPQAPDVSVEANPGYGASPLIVSFTGIATDPDGGTIVNYEWDFGDGSAVESGATLTNVSHTYNQTVTATTVYTATLSVTDNEARVGTDTEEITLYPALFFDDFEDGDASDWIAYVDDDWVVASEDTYMLRTPAINGGRHIKAPLPNGAVLEYGTIRVDMKFLTSSTTTYKTGMIMWSFVSDTDFRYAKVDYDNQQIILGYRDIVDQNAQVFNASGWSIPVDQKMSLTIVFRPDGSVKAILDGVEIGEYDYTYAKAGGVGLATRKSQTFFDNFMVAQVSDANSPPNVTIDPVAYASPIFPATVSYTVTADDPDGDNAKLHYYWRFGDGGNSVEQNPTHEFIYEGVYIATLDVTDEPSYGGDPETTTKYSYAHVGVDFYDNFNDGDFTDWVVVVDSDWSIVDNALRSGLTNTNNVIFSPYTEANSLSYGKVCARIKIIENTDNLKENAVLLFGWQDVNEEYRFVRFDRDESSIKIMHDDNVSMETEDASVGYNVPLNQYFHTCVKVEPLGGTGDKVTVLVEGMQVLTHNYSSLLHGKWGLRAGKSTTAFDDYVIFDEATLNSTAADIDTNVIEYDFGEVKLSQAGGATYTLTIYNRSPVGNGENLTVNNFSIANTDYTIEDAGTGATITSLANPILPGDSVDVVIRYEPAVEENDAATLIISSNDPDEPTYAVSLNGEGVISLRPTATITVTPSSGSGPAPLTVIFEAVATDPDGDDAQIQYEWNFGDGSPVVNIPNTSHVYDTPGDYTATLTLTDESTQTNTYDIDIHADDHYFLDTFNDGDISDWTPHNISNWSVYDDSGELRLDGNNQDLVDGWDHVIAPPEANFTDDVIVEWDAMVTEAEGKQIYLLFDFQDINNYSYIRFRHNKSKWVIGKVESGLDTELAGDIFNLVRNFLLHYKVEFLNGEITVWVDSVLMVNAFNYGTLSNGKNGLAILETRAFFDNYKVTFSDFGAGNQSPTLSIAASTTSGPAPLEVTFTATADDPDGNNAFLTYSWDFGDATGTSTAQNPIYTYTAAGTFTATCVVTDSGSPAMTAQDTIEIVVTTGNRAPELAVSANPTAGNSPLDVTFTAVGNDPDFDTITYEWDFGDGSATTSVQNPTHQYTADGNYIATCTATDDGSPVLSTSETVSILAGNLFIDDFEDGDVSNWTFRNAQYWNTIDLGGSIRLQGTQESSVDGWEHAIAPPSAEFMDTGIIEVEALIVEGDGTQFYFVFDFVDENNFGCVRFRMNRNTWILYKVVAGVWNEVNTGTVALVRDIWVQYKIEFTSGSFDLTVNSVSVASGIAYGSFTSAKNGVGTLETKATFDNYKVTFTGGGSPNQAPTLTIAASPTTGSSPLEVTFTSTADDPDGDNASIVYAWNFGDGAGTSTAANPTYTYTSDGTYTATCTITDSGSPALTAQDTQEIIVTAGNTAPTLTINATPTTGSSPLAVSFTATGDDPNGDNITYLWDFGDSSGTTPTQNPSHSYTADGTYTATCTVTDDGSPVLSTTETLQINVGGTAFFLDDFEDSDVSDWTFRNAQYWNTIDMDGSIRLQGTQISSIDGWEFATAPASAEFQDTGIMEFDAHVLDGDGTSFYFVFDFVDANNFGAIRIRFNRNRWELLKVVNGTWTEITRGDSTLSRNVWEHYKLEFTNGSFSLTVGAAEVATGIVYGAFTSGTNGIGTLETKATFDNYKVTFTGSVTPNQPPTVSVSANPTTGTLPLTVTFTAAGNDPEGTAMTYSWNFGDGAGASSLQNPVYDYTTEGTFTATCTVTDSGSPQATGTDTIVISPVASNHAPTLAIAASPTSGKPSLTVDFTATGNDQDGDNMTYSWEFGDGSPDHTSTLQNPQHTFTATGTFDVTCTVTDDGSPVMTATENLTIKVSDSVFDDDFNDGDISDWNILDAGWNLYNAGGGDYHLSVIEGGATILAPVAAEFSSGRKLEFDVMFRSGQVYAGLKLRALFDYVDTDNFGMVYLNGSGSYIELRKTVASTGTALYTTTYNFVLDTWYHVEITYSSSNVSLSIDSTPVFSNIAYGPFLIEQIGFRVEKSALFIDNVLITE